MPEVNERSQTNGQGNSFANGSQFPCWVGWEFLEFVIETKTSIYTLGLS